MSFVRALARDGLFLLRSEAPGGVPQWHILEIAAHRRHAFKAALEKGENIDCSHWGTLHASGTGEHPPAHILHGLMTV